MAGNRHVANFIRLAMVIPHVYFNIKIALRMSDDAFIRRDTYYF